MRTRVVLRNIPNVLPIRTDTSSVARDDSCRVEDVVSDERGSGTGCLHTSVRGMRAGRETVEVEHLRRYVIGGGDYAQANTRMYRSGLVKLSIHWERRKCGPPISSC